MNETLPEAEAPAPAPIRGLRAMAVVRWILLAAVALAAAGTWWVFVLHTGAPVSGPDKYYCPMHPQIRSPVPGTCPICFMNLEPIPDERTAGATTDAGPPPSAPEPGETPSGLSTVMLTLERREAVGVATTLASRRSVTRELHLPAVIEAPERAVSEVRVRSGAFVERVAPVETGHRVRAGQPLLWVYSPEILRAEEELLTASRMPRGVSPVAAGDEAVEPLGERVSDAARARLLLLGVDASDIDAVLRAGRAERLVPVRAPSSGIVTARDVVPGTYAMPEMMLFQVTDLSRVWASATASVEDMASIAPGLRGRFVSRADEHAHDVEAILVEPLVSPETRTSRVRFIARNQDTSLLPGDIGEVVVSLPAEEHVLVPRDAAIDLGRVRYVFVEQAEGLFAPRVVELGPLIGDERAVLRGLEPGERVVARGAFLLDSESRLQSALAPARADAGAAAPPPHAHEHEGTMP